MKNLSQNLIAEKNKMSSDAPWLILIVIVLNNDEGTTFHLVRNTENITFGGNEYTAFPFELEPTKYGSKGEIPTLTLRVCNITRLIQPYLEDLDGGVGSTVTLTVVNANLLAEDYSELEMMFDVLASSSSAVWVEFILGAPSLLRRRMPLYRYLALHCRWKFKSEECKYGEGSGEIETSCNRTLERCRELNNTSNYGGFIGMKSGGIKIV